VEKSVPPDVCALLFFLKNRCPERWRERIEPADEPESYDFDEDDREL